MIPLLPQTLQVHWLGYHQPWTSPLTSEQNSFHTSGNQWRTKQQMLIINCNVSKIAADLPVRWMVYERHEAEMAAASQLLLPGDLLTYQWICNHRIVNCPLSNWKVNLNTALQLKPPDGTHNRFNSILTSEKHVSLYPQWDFYSLAWPDCALCHWVRRKRVWSNLNPTIVLTCHQAMSH